MSVPPHTEEEEEETLAPVQAGECRRAREREPYLPIPHPPVGSGGSTPGWAQGRREQPGSAPGVSSGGTGAALGQGVQEPQHLTEYFYPENVNKCAVNRARCALYSAMIKTGVCKADRHFSYKSEDAQKEERRSLCDRTATAEVLPSGCVAGNRVTGLLGLSLELEQLLLYRDVRLLPWETGEPSFVSSLTP